MAGSCAHYQPDIDFNPPTNPPCQVAALASEVATLREQLELTRDEAEQTKLEDNTFYLMVCGVFVFLMQAGFALLAAGSIRAKNVNALLPHLPSVRALTLQWHIAHPMPPPMAAGRR